MFRPAFVAAIVPLIALTSCLTGNPPEAPAWDTDVYPIIRGSCSHCHGEMWKLTGLAAFRFDVCDPQAFQATGANPATLGQGALLLAPAIRGAVEPDKGARPRMPPPPAAPLSDYEQTVIRNWARRIELLGDKTRACEKPSGNREPTAKFVSAAKEGPDLVAFIDVSDPDNDVVLGKVEGASEDVTSGRRKVQIPGAAVGDRIRLKLSDGYVTVERELTTK